MKEGGKYGLAHFTEHMLFLGSKKYPNPTQFVDYISLNNGRFNGYTGFDQTAYYFKIHPDRFEKGLDIFSRFFIDPLFDSDYIKKEINSVNSEYERNVQLDSRRKEQVLRQLAHKHSSFHRFTTGNRHSLLQNLSSNQLRKSVLEFYGKYYIPENMNLIIYGNEDVNYYKKLIKNTFKNMKARKKADDWKAPKHLPFKFFNEGKLALYQTINKHQVLDIYITLSDLYKSLPHNIGLFYKTLLNFKGKGSLYDRLRKKGWGTRVYSYIRKAYKGLGFFRIIVHLSKLGIKKIKNVLKLIYIYLNKIRKLSLNKKLYNYVKRYYDFRFFFVRKRNSVLRLIRKVCMGLKYPRKYILAQHKLLHKFDKKVNKQFSKYFVINNSIILLGNQQFNSTLTKNFRSFLKMFKNSFSFTNQDPWYLEFNN